MSGTPHALAELKGRIDFAIITIKAEELSAVLTRFALTAPTVMKGARDYAITHVERVDGSVITVAMTRCPAQGNGVAQDVARDIIEELDPRWLLVVGIAGGIAGAEFSLGDVVLASHVLDFSVEAVKQGKSSEYAMGADRPMSRCLEKSG